MHMTLTTLTPPMTRIAVALPVPVYRLFDYDTGSFPTPEGGWTGCRVRVSFGSRVLVGIVIDENAIEENGPLWSAQDAAQQSAANKSATLKTILDCLDTAPLLSPSLLALLRWSANYYHYPVGQVLDVALPKLVGQGRSIEYLTEYWRALPQRPSSPNQPSQKKPTESLLNRSPKQAAAFAILQLHDERGAPESALVLMGAARKQLLQLEAKGLAQRFQVEAKPHPASCVLAQLPLTANPEQQHAIGHILNHRDAYAGFLLEGITGSGKTEVYLQVMDAILQAGKQVLVLVPEIGLTPQTLHRFQARFHTEIALLHSGLTDLARFKAWHAAANGHARIVIGTRSAIFTPMPALGLIVVDEEHDSSFKQQDSFRYHARDVALQRGYREHIPVVLGSATPSIESLHLAFEHKLHRLLLTQRAGNARQATMQAVDLRGQKRDHGLCPAMIAAIREQLEQGKQVLIFLNRRGYAPVLVCGQCGWQADCPRCDAHLTVHSEPSSFLQCHHCALQCRLPPACMACGSPQLTPTGTGTVRLEEGLRERFPEIPLLRVDRDSTQRQGSWEDIYAHAMQDKPLILLGTQMLAKGHHFPYVTLVAIVDADAGFLSADFRAPEKAAQLILQVAGRAGRGHHAGKVLIQTWQPDNPLLVRLITEGYNHFALTMMQERKQSQLPPYRHAALVRVESLTKTKTADFLALLLSVLQADGRSKFLEIWGPIPAPMERKAGVFRGHLFLMASQRKLLHDVLDDWWPKVWQHPSRQGIRVSLDIDPQEMS